MLFICSACVCTVPTTKDSLFPFLSLSLPLPPSSLSLWLSEEKGNVDSIKEQGSHLLLWFTALLGWVRSGRGGWIRVLGDFSCGSRKKATSIWQQSVRAVLAGRCTLLPHARVGCHILHAHTHTHIQMQTHKGETTEIKNKENTEGWMNQRERRHQSNGADRKEEQTKASDSHHKHGNPDIWPHMAACKPYKLTSTLRQGKKQHELIITHTHTGVK